MKKNNLSLLPETPFAIGTPERVIFYNRNDAIKYINKLNGKNRIFVSLYCCNKIKLNKIWFDFDSVNSYTNVKKFHEWCNNKNIMHMVVFSGGGFHFTIFTENYENIIDPKLSLKAIHKYLANELNFSINETELSDIDFHVIGDVQRIYSFPGTYNTKRKRWVTSLSSEEILSGLDNIKELSKTQRNIIHIMNDKYFDISSYKDVKVEYININIPISTAKITLTDDDNDIKIFPQCIQNVLLNINDCQTWKNRYLFTIWAKELGISPEQCDAIAKKYFTRSKRIDGFKNNYNHYKRVKVIDYVYTHDDILPSCEKVYIDYGVCIGKCEWYMTKN